MTHPDQSDFLANRIRYVQNQPHLQQPPAPETHKDHQTPWFIRPQNHQGNQVYRATQAHQAQQLPVYQHGEGEDSPDPQFHQAARINTHSIQEYRQQMQDVEQPGHLEPRDFSRFRSLLVHQISLGSSGPRITRAIRFTGPPKLTRPSSFIRPKDHQTTKVHRSPTTEEENTSHMG